MYVGKFCYARADFLSVEVLALPAIVAVLRRALLAEPARPVLVVVPAVLKALGALAHEAPEDVRAPRLRVAVVQVGRRTFVQI